MPDIGATLRTSDGLPIQVLRSLGTGGQGEVFEVDLEGGLLALKWYHSASATPEQAEALRVLVSRGAPDPRFLWPLAFVPGSSQGAFGYLMPLREKRFSGLEALVLARISPTPSWHTLCTAAIAMADCYRRLHLQGLCYKDIAFGNAFLDPAKGDVRICDNDNVRVNRAPVGSILGTCCFMAPEVLLGRAAPSIESDLHSLAVLFYFLLVREHPLDGARLAQVNAFTPAAQARFYGSEPVFVFDPSDPSNRPVPGIHDTAIRNWALYPALLREVFTRAFTEGLRDPGRRVREGEWMHAMSNLRDTLFLCSVCWREHYYDRARMAKGARTMTCARCGAQTCLPLRMKLGNRVVMLNPDTCLFPHHLGKDFDFSQPVLKLVHHPMDASRWGMKNLGTETWSFRRSDGEVREVAPGQNLALVDGLEIHFGLVTGQVRME